MNIDQLEARLTVEEGKRLAAYIDSLGILSVGIGHNCVAKPVPGVEKVGDTISEILCRTLFEADVLEACTELDKHIPWWRKLDDARQNVMVDLCFNMGMHTLMQFHNTLAAIEAGNYEAAAEGLKHSLWDKQVGTRADWLENVMKTGVYA